MEAATREPNIQGHRTERGDADDVMSTCVFPPGRRKRFSGCPTGADGDHDGGDRWDGMPAPVSIRVSFPSRNPQPFNGGDPIGRCL